MERDMDLCRTILLELEKVPYTGSYIRNLPVGNHPPEDVSYHIKLLMDAGLIEGTEHRDISLHYVNWLPVRITYAGHEFLETARKNTTWESCKRTMVEKTGGVSLDVLKELLKLAARSAVGL
jgi:hypothetical protein